MQQKEQNIEQYVKEVDNRVRKLSEQRLREYHNEKDPSNDKVVAIVLTLPPNSIRL